MVQHAVARCLSLDCGGDGVEKFSGYCPKCADTLGIAQAIAAEERRNRSTAAPAATPASTEPVLVSSPEPPAQPQCIGQCGFYGKPEQYGLCSSCFKNLSSDLFLRAVASVLADRTDGILAFLRNGGSLTRTVTSAECDSLRKFHLFVAEGQTLSQIANEKNSMTALMYILERDAAATTPAATDTFRRETLSALLKPSGSTDTGGGGFEDRSPSDAAVATTAESTQEKPRNTHGGWDDDEPLLVENVRLEILSTETHRSDGLVSLWTAWGDVPASPTAVAGRSLATQAPPFPPSSSKKCDDDADEPQPVLTSSSYDHQQQPRGKCFALPRSIVTIPEAERRRSIGRFLEQEEMLPDTVKATGFVASVPECDAFWPLYTVADLNCLLHAAFMGMVGVRDGMLASDDPDASKATTRTVLRNAVRNALLQCIHLQRVVAPAAPVSSRKSTPPPAPTASSGGGGDAAAAEGTSGPDSISVDVTRLAEIHRDIEQGKASLDGGHIFALANVLRRPIVVYAHVGLEGEFREGLSVPFRVSGIYLPLLWPPEAAIKDPLLMCYSSGHFSSLVGTTDETRPTVTVPLCDEEFKPLPIHFVAETCAALDRAAAEEEKAHPEQPAHAHYLTRFRDVRPVGEAGPRCGPWHRAWERQLLALYVESLRVVSLLDGSPASAPPSPRPASSTVGAEEDPDDVQTTPPQDQPTDADEGEEKVPLVTLCTQRVEIPPEGRDSEACAYNALIHAAVEEVVRTAVVEV